MLADSDMYWTWEKHTSKNCIPRSNDGRAARDEATGNRHASWRRISVPARGYGGMESQCLVDDGVEERQLLQGADIADVRNTLELLKELIGQQRILGQLVKEEYQCRRHRVAVEPEGQL